VDTNTNVSEYEASINPSVSPDVYKGSEANKIFVAANEPRLGTFPCDFCSSSSTGKKGGNILAVDALTYNELWTEGYVNVELEDDKGRKVGYDKDGKFINEIEEARVQPVMNGPLSEVPPIIKMPAGLGFTAYIYGDDKAAEEPASLVMIGKGFYIGVDDIVMAPDQLDQLAFDAEGDFLTYTTDAQQSPDIVVGIEKDKADFELVLKAVKASKGTDIHVLFDQKEDTFAFETTSDGPAQFSISITRIGEDGKEETFDTGDTLLDVDSGKFMYFYFGKWDGQGSNLEVGYDENGNGEIEESEITNMADAE
jgi:outer membrane protein assembly factor BamB